MNTGEVLKLFPELRLVTLHRWCQCGLFGRHNLGDGSGSRRNFNHRDLEVLAVCCQVSVALKKINGNGANPHVLGEVARAVRSGERSIIILLTEDISLEIDTEDILEDLDEALQGQSPQVPNT